MNEIAALLRQNESEVAGVFDARALGLYEQWVQHTVKDVVSDTQNIMLPLVSSAPNPSEVGTRALVARMTHGLARVHRERDGEGGRRLVLRKVLGEGCVLAVEL